MPKRKAARLGRAPEAILKLDANENPYGPSPRVRAALALEPETADDPKGIDPVALHAKDGRPAVPLKLTSREQTDLVVFLQSLSTFANPWRPDDGGRCE